jgi:uncharacterized membrane protein YhaH (DUF805 family)
MFISKPLGNFLQYELKEMTDSLRICFFYFGLMLCFRRFHSASMRLAFLAFSTLLIFVGTSRHLVCNILLF